MKWKRQNFVESDKVIDFGMRLQLQDENTANSHDHEAADPLDSDEESSQEASERQQNNIVSEGSVSDDDEKFNPSSMQDQSPSPSSPFGVNEGFESSSLENQRSLDKAPLNVAEESDVFPTHNQSSRGSPPLNVTKEINPMDLNAENNNVTLQTSDICSTLTEHHAVAQISEGCHNVPQPGSDHPISAASPLEMPCSPAKNVWASIGLPESYRSTPTALYASSSEPSVRHPQVFSKQSAVLIDLESDLSEVDTTKDLFNKHATHLPLFNRYPNRDRCELLQSPINNDNHQHEQKKTRLDSNPATDVTLEPSLFPGHVRDQLQSSYRMDNRHESQSQQLYINLDIHDSLYPDNSYPVQGLGHVSISNSTDWSNARIPTPLQAPQFSSGELLNHNWFGSENRTHGGWSGSDASFSCTQISEVGVVRIRAYSVFSHNIRPYVLKHHTTPWVQPTCLSR